MKKCSKCGIEKEYSEYYKHNGTKDNLFPYCKGCQLKYQKEYHLKNPNYWKAYRDYRKKYSKTEKAKATIKRYQQTEKYKEKYKESRNTLKRTFYDYKRGAEIRNKSFELTREQFALYWKKPCIYCQSDIETIGLDRVDNLIGYNVDNVVPCCKICNYAKSNMSLVDFHSWAIRIGKNAMAEQWG